MEIRKIKPEENILSNMIGTVAFLGSHDYTEELKEPMKHTEGYEHTWAAFDNGKMTTSMGVIPFEIMFDGKVEKMAGIGGVATLPEARNKGAVRNTLKKSLEYMLELGCVFSYLFPFSHEYYRKFGYELAFKRRELTVPLTAFRFLERSGSLKFYQVDDSIEDIKGIHRQFAKDKNLILVRSNKHWEEKLKKDPYAKRIYTYTWYNKKDEPKSYITFEPKTNDGETDLFAHEFIWADNEGLVGMLAHLPIFYPSYKKLQWYTPEWVNFHSFLEDPSIIHEQTGCYGMNRILDVKKALERMRYPKDSGEMVIEVTDDFLPLNTGVYKLEWSEEKGSLVTKGFSGDADMIVDIRGLNQLVTGFCTPKDLEMFGKVRIVSNRDVAEKLFCKKDSYFTDFF